MIGAQVGSYRLLHRLGAGGMGEVWAAEHVVLGRRAAIKLLHPAYAQRADIVTRFFNEARAATEIADPGIVQIFDFGQAADGSAFIVMEMLEGEPLDRRLARLGVLPPAQALPILRQVATALAAAHARGIVHRDLKPENIFLVRDPAVAGGERAKLLDFGIAKLGGSASLTQTQAVLGTPMYMAPEQCRGAGKVDHRADLYALGCVLMALLTGRPPFDGEGAGEQIAQHLFETPEPPSRRVSGLAPALDALVLRLLAKEPADRVPSASALAGELAQLLGRADVTDARPVQRTTIRLPAPAVTTLSAATGSQLPPPRARRGAALAAGAAVIGGLIVISALALSRPTASSRGAIVAPPSPPVPALVRSAPPIDFRPLLHDATRWLRAQRPEVLERLAPPKLPRVAPPVPDHDDDHIPDHR